MTLGLTAAAPAEGPPQEIVLEAASSDLDRRGERLFFRDVRIQQGDIVITAAEAETRELEFSRGRWDFRGNVRIDGPMGAIEADRANVGFGNHRLQSALAEGAPARFTRTMPGPEARQVDGTANEIRYDLAEGELMLLGQATLNDGVRSASGARLVYRVKEDRLIASGDDESLERVRIIITPPEQEKEPSPDLAEPAQEETVPEEPLPPQPEPGH